MRLACRFFLEKETRIMIYFLPLPQISTNMYRFIILSISLLLLVACHEKDDPEPPVTIAERTVLVYMSGENNLTYDSSDAGSYLEDDLDEILEGSNQLNSKQHLICFIDSVGTTNYPHIVEISNGKTEMVYRYDTDFYASDPDRMKEVITWVMNKYPAKEYGLVLWGHATGWAVEADTVAATAKTRQATRAYGQDRGWDLTGDDKNVEKWMNITQMASALEQLPNKFKFIFADCCCMGCIECAYELRNSADYYIASPAEIPGEGAPYQLIVPKLFSTSSNYYKEIAQCYYDYMLEAYQQPDYSQWPYLKGYSVPMAVFDLSKMDNLAAATKKLMATFMPQYPEELNLNGHPFYFAFDTPVMYDVKSVFSQYAAEADYREWLQTYNAAVPFQIVSKQWMTGYNAIYNGFSYFPKDEDQWGCSSMFFPQARYNNYSRYRYNQRIHNLQWYQAVDWASYGW